MDVKHGQWHRKIKLSASNGDVVAEDDSDQLERKNLVWDKGSQMINIMKRKVKFIGYIIS